MPVPALERCSVTASTPESSSAFTVTVTVPRSGDAGAVTVTGVGAALSICTCADGAGRAVGGAVQRDGAQVVDVVGQRRRVQRAGVRAAASVQTVVHVSTSASERSMRTDATPVPASAAVAVRAMMPRTSEAVGASATDGPRLSTMRAATTVEVRLLPAASRAIARRS